MVVSMIFDWAYDVFTEEEDYDEPYDDVEAEDGVINYKNHHEEFSAEDDFDDF